MSNQKRTLIAIGLEAAEPAMIRDGIASGKLPHFAELYKRGTWKLLESCTEVSSGATWASVNTGTNPGKHGMGFYHRQLKAGTYTIRKKYADEIGRPPFWQLLSQAGKRIAVLDIPETTPTLHFNGVILVGWGAEGLNWKQSSYPKSFLREVKQKFGKHPLENWYQARPKDKDGWVAFAHLLMAATQQRSRIIQWVLEREAWALVFAVYAETHWAGHFFWFLREPDHPDYDPALAEACGDVVFKVYEAVDAGIGSLLEKHPEADFLIFSNTGMGPNYSGLHLMPEFLERIGLGRASGMSKTEVLKPQKRWGPYAIKKIEDFVGPGTIQVVKKFIPERLWDSVTRHFLTIGHAWDQTKAFCVPSDYSATLRINLKGREPHGKVAGGREYDEVCATIQKEALALVDAATGKSPVKEVVKTREKYHGDQIDELPDLIIKWQGDAPVTAIESATAGKIMGTLPDKRTGAHFTDGFIIASGPHFQKAGELARGNIMDIAPTILHYLGQRIPDDFDGHFDAQMFR